MKPTRRNRGRTRGREKYIRRIADKLAKENLLVAVKSVDDQAQELVDLSLKSEGLGISHLHVRHRNQMLREKEIEEIEEKLQKDAKESVSEIALKLD